MSECMRCRWLACFAFALLLLPLDASAEDLTALQLDELMSAASGRYRTIDMRLTQTAYEPTNSETKAPVIRAEYDITWRWTPSRIFATAGVRLGTERFIESFITTSEWCRTLRKYPDRAMGSVLPPNQIGASFGSDIRQVAFGGWGGLGWELLRREGASVSRDPDTGCYVVRKSKEGNVFEMVIDPSKGYLMRKASAGSTAEPELQTCVLSDFRQVEDGLWLPFHYEIRSQLGINTHSVLEAHVNREIPATDMEIVFPDGTSVDDQIANVIYTVGDAHSTTKPTVATAISKPTVVPAIAKPTVAPAIMPATNDRGLQSLPRGLRVGQVPYGGETKSSIVVMRQGQAMVGELKAVPSVPWITVEIGKDMPQRLYLTVTIRPPTNIRQINEDIRLEGKDKDDFLRLLVRGVVQPAVQVDPRTILVETGAQEFTLNVTRADAKPALLQRYEAHGEGIKVVSCRPHPLQQGKLVLQIDRERDHREFCRSVLSLQFQDFADPVEVVLVSPPLDDGR